MKALWTEEHIEYLKAARARGLSYEEIGDRLGRTALACQTKHKIIVRQEAGRPDSMRPVFQTVLDPDDPGISSPKDEEDREAIRQGSQKLLAALKRHHPEIFAA